MVTTMTFVVVVVCTLYKSSYGQERIKVLKVNSHKYPYFSPFVAFYMSILAIYFYHFVSFLSIENLTAYTYVP